MSSAITTYTGRLTAQERAAIVWGITPTTPEQARINRLMAAIRRTERPVRVAPPAAWEPWQPGMKWRYLQYELGNEERRTACRMCAGTGELTVSDGAGGVDYDDCPRCQRANPYLRKTDDIPF